MGKKLSQPGETRSRAAAPLRGKEPVEVVQASDEDATRAPSYGGVLARPTARRPRGRPKTRWWGYISSLAWERLGIPQSELADMARDREIWGSLLKLLNSLDLRSWPSCVCHSFMERLFSLPNAQICTFLTALNSINYITLFMPGCFVFRVDKFLFQRVARFELIWDMIY